MGEYPAEANRKDPICFTPYLYKARNLIERFFNKIKHYRRITTRYDKLAENYLAALKLVAVRIWLRGTESTSLPREAQMKRAARGGPTLRGLRWRAQRQLREPASGSQPVEQRRR